MNAIFCVDWATVLSVAGSLGVVALMLLLSARMQIQRPGLRPDMRASRTRWLSI